MNTLKCLIKSLNASEIRLVEDFYKVRSQKKRMYKSRLKLFRLLTGTFTDEQVIKRVSCGKSGFLKLQKELHQDIMDILMFFEANANPKEDSEMECRKHLIQGKLMINRGLIDEGITTLKSTLAKSEQLELYDISLSIYRILSSYENESFYDESSPSFHVLAKDYAFSVLHSVKEHPDSYSREEVAGLHLEIANLFLKQQSYNDAIDYSSSAAQNMKVRLAPKLAALRIMFLAYFHTGDLANASRIEKEVSSSPQMYSSSKLVAVWSLNRAVLQYGKGNYWGSMETLKSNYPIIRNSPFWVAGYRFLEILNVIELRDYEWVEYKLNVMKKLIAKRPKGIPMRMKMCYKLLRKYLDFKRHPHKPLFNIDQIKVKPAWDPLSSEVINIEEWYKERMY